jgi:hypothetical protein
VECCRIIPPAIEDANDRHNGRHIIDGKSDYSIFSEVGYTQSKMNIVALGASMWEGFLALRSNRR